MRESSPGSVAARVRTVQASRGVAQARGGVISNPGHPFSPWGRWYPWYSYGPGSYYGHVAYNPWLYGSTLWTWNRYGWHDPYLYDPYGSYGYDPYYWPSGGGGTVTFSDDRDEDEGEATGALRLRVSPQHARVYVDGALAGVAEDFSGLSNHLDIPAGVHQIEFRADGYATYSREVNVKAGQTRTERASLEKQ